jgi:hypothetical protein
MQPEEAALRRWLVDEGLADEMLRVLVALGEMPEQENAISYLLEHFGQCTQPPLVNLKAPLEECLASFDVLEENRRLKNRVSELQSELKVTIDKIKASIPEGTLTVFNIAAYGVPDVDVSGGISDPFVRISLLDAELEDDDGVPLGREMDPVEFRDYCEKHRIAAQTSTIQNAENPKWPDEVLDIVLPAGTPRPPRVLVRIWDDDKGKSDDPLASLEVQLEPFGGKCEQLALKGRGDLPDVLIDFEYKMLEVDAATRARADVA